MYAPVAGTITDQQITNQAGVQALTPPNPFTISDMSHVSIVCDVWENDMAQVAQSGAARYGPYLRELCRVLHGHRGGRGRENSY